MRLNREISGRRATIHFVDGSAKRVTDLFLLPDSVKGYVGDSRYQVWSTRTISKIETIDRKRQILGFLEGVVIGAGSGLLVGKTVLSQLPCHNDSIVCQLAVLPLRTAFGPVAIASSFGFVGGAVNALATRPRRVDYVVEDEGGKERAGH